MTNKAYMKAVTKNRAAVNSEKEEKMKKHIFLRLSSSI